MNEPTAAHTPSARWSRGMPGTEGRLMRRAAEGDSRAFETIFKRHGQELYRYCLAILRRPEDAQDALQSTMANALRALPGESREIALRPWLFRVAHNESITLLRQRQTAIDPDEVVDETVQGADATAADRERLRTLVADLGSLPQRQRSALVLRELNGMSHSEVASALEISPGATRQAVYEARSALAEIGEGRAMECEGVRKRISARDRRLLRGRKVRAHLRHCDGCQSFLAAIDQRRADFSALCPPLPAAAAASVLAAVTGGAVSGGGGAGLAAAGGLGAASAKGVATVAAVAALGVGGAGYSGALDIPLPGKTGDEASESSTSTAPTGAGAESGSAGAANRGEHGRSAGNGQGRRSEHGNRSHGNGSARGTGNGTGSAGATSNAGGNGNGGASSYAPGTSGATPPGHGGTPPGQLLTPPGQANGASNGGGGQATAPGRSTAPGQSSNNGHGNH